MYFQWVVKLSLKQCLILLKHDVIMFEMENNGCKNKKPGKTWMINNVF